MTPGMGARRRLPGDLVAVVVIHVVLRLLMDLGGARVRVGHLDYAWQLLDPEVLRTDPVGGIARLHIQPPLYNATIAGALAIPAPPEVTLRIIGAVLALALVIGVWWLVRRWTGRPGVALAAGVMCSTLPSVIVGEYLPSYELGVMVGLVWAVAAADALSTKRATPSPWVRGALLGAPLAIVVLTRSLFHPLWAVAVLALVAWFLPRPDRRALAGAVAVLVVAVVPWTVRTAVMFGDPSWSSWFGMNLQRVAVNPLTPEQHREMAAAGRRSSVTDAPEFQALDMYPLAADCVPAAKHPALADAVKSTTRNVKLPNFNHLCYLPIYRSAGEDARRAMVDHPDAYLRGVGASGRFFLAAIPAGTEGDGPVVDALDVAWRYLLLAPDHTIDFRDWVFPLAGLAEVVVPLSLTLMVAVPASAMPGMIAVMRRIRRRPPGRPMGLPPVGAVVLGATVAWCTLVGVLAESGENARFRAMIDPLIVVAVTTMAAGVLRRRDRTGESERGGDRGAAGSRPLPPRPW